MKDYFRITISNKKRQDSHQVQMQFFQKKTLKNEEKKNH